MGVGPRNKWGKLSVSFDVFSVKLFLSLCLVTGCTIIGNVPEEIVVHSATGNSFRPSTIFLYQLRLLIYRWTCVTCMIFIKISPLRFGLTLNVQAISLSIEKSFNVECFQFRLLARWDMQTTTRRVKCQKDRGCSRTEITYEKVHIRFRFLDTIRNVYD